MKQVIQEQLQQAVNGFLTERRIDPEGEITAELERARDDKHGDFASNVAMTLARTAKMKPRDIAEGILRHLPESTHIEKVEIAGPGFINFFLHSSAYHELVPVILAAAENYGHNQLGAGKRILIEFVSANPTGPLHIGHGRGAAYGAALAEVLSAAGYRVTREYYVNDAGRQMDILTLSIWLRYLHLCGIDVAFPAKAYQGQYIRDIAARLHGQHGDRLQVEAGLLAPALSVEDPEQQLDDGIALAHEHLGRDSFSAILDTGLEIILDDIRTDLEEFGVHFDIWFSERSLVHDNAIRESIASLREHGDIYEAEGAQWFRSSEYGDEKDRVVIRENGQATYFASDIAYHMNKYARGFEHVIDIWGADHHGYIDRVRGALRALGRRDSELEILLVQFATLYRGSEKLPMSTRSGEYVTLRDLRQEVGNDAARFFYVTRKSEQHLDFDMELATSQSSDNPVYYIQYAHARICSVLGQMAERGYSYDQTTAYQNLSRLVEGHEQATLKTLSRYPEVIESAARSHEPHLVAFYLRDLATDFHTYYNTHQFLVEEAELRQSRISLILATRQVISNGLAILGVSAPENM